MSLKTLRSSHSIRLGNVHSLGGRMFLVIAMCVSLGACVQVEFDRMSGTTFPPELMIDGEEVTVQSVYADAGFSVSVNEVETGIPPLAIPESECITDAELDALEVGHRSSPLFPNGLNYFLYGIVVDHFGEALDVCVPNWVLGKMWAGHTRSAFAIFYLHGGIVAGGEEYLRTTIHEIGHALNLHHQDGDGSTTIMNQSSDLAENWVFEFSADSIEHLQNHPSKCKYPGAVGGAPFTWVITQHADSHAGTTTFDCN